MRSVVLADSSLPTGLEEVLASHDDGIYTEDVDGIVTSWNRGAERLYGRAATVASGQSSDLLYPKHRRAELATLRQRVHAGELVKDYRIECNGRNGDVIQISMSAGAVRDREGIARGAWITARDLTEQKLAQAALLESDARLEEAQALAHVGTWTWDAVTDTVQLSQELHRMHGIEPLSFDGKLESYIALVQDDRRGPLLAALRDACDTGQAFEREYRIVVHGTGERWVYARAEPATNSDGRTVGLRGIAQDVTEHKKAAAALERHAASLEFLRRVTVAANQSQTLEEALSVCLEAICNYAGWSVGRVYLASPSGEEALSTRIWHLADPERFASFGQVNGSDAIARGVGLVGRVLASCQPAWSTDLTGKGEFDGAPAATAVGLRSGVAFPVQVGEEAVAVLEFLSTKAGRPGDELLHLMATATTQLGRVVERSRAAAVLSDQAMHDPLTRLPNRNLFLDRLRHALSQRERRGTQVAVLLVNLDAFKWVNDSLGHEAGDAVLVTLGRRIQGALRPEDTVGRFGGDEFAILCEGLETEEEVLAVTARVSNAVAQPLSLNIGVDAVISASTGVAFAGDSTDDPERLLRNADLAMYRAKEKGGARYEIFDSVMHAQALDRLKTVSLLRHAIGREELRLFYQPQISLESGETIGSEALVRWQHPERGLLSPDLFIHLAEQSQLIIPVGNWVVGEACRQAVSWQAATLQQRPLKMAVNVSAKQLAHSDLAGLLASTLRETGMDAESLCLEITESVLMADADFYIQALLGLKRLGVTIAIDDFGMGYSSLAYLQRFPVDILKIDMAFVSGLGHGNRPNSAIVGAIVDLCRALGLTSIAEGVETPEQMRDLRELGCDIGQGFYFGRPQPADA